MSGLKRKRSVEERPRLSKEAYNDPRFKKITTDKRFKTISGKETKVKLDNRFKGMLKDEKFASLGRWLLVGKF